MFQVVLYCPDRHLTYEGSTPDRVGVGGGVTARIRLAQALAGAGCRVRIVANVPRPHALGSVELVPLESCRSLSCDVLILNSTGGKLDLSPVLELDVRARLRQVWVGGEARVQGLETVGYDFVVAPSNYVRKVIGEVWGVPSARRLVIHNGVPEPAKPSWLGRVERDPFRLIYTGHPMKGLAATLELLRLLRAEDRRFRLDVFGGPRLWGQEETPFDPPEGVAWHGLVGQKTLAPALLRAGFSINLQGIADGFGIALAEAMAAGCIAAASHIGAYPELIRHGYDGFLVPGDHASPETLARVAALLIDLVKAPDFCAYLRRNASRSPLPWSVVARAWVGHWQRFFSSGEAPGGEACPECGAERFALADGWHCPGCGRYSRGADGP
ncbi:MAG TPA: glycosyltransferase [Thermoanaerobaculia bacterium]|nr:glycosyltransferase [Thermoanaerobaculia bacterium]